MVLTGDGKLLRLVDYLPLKRTDGTQNGDGISNSLSKSKTRRRNDGEMMQRKRSNVRIDILYAAPQANDDMQRNDNKRLAVIVSTQSIVSMQSL